jgi:hypothetical protein
MASFIKLASNITIVLLAVLLSLATTRAYPGSPPGYESGSLTPITTTTTTDTSTPILPVINVNKAATALPPSVATEMAIDETQSSHKHCQMNYGPQRRKDCLTNHEPQIYDYFEEALAQEGAMAGVVKRKNKVEPRTVEGHEVDPVFVCGPKDVALNCDVLKSPVMIRWRKKCPWHSRWIPDCRFPPSKMDCCGCKSP